MSPAFRIAQIDDVPALRRLVERAYRGDSAKFGWTHEADLLDDERTSETDLAATIAEPTSRIILAEAAGTLTGTVTITDLGGARAYLGMLCVDPSLQAAGLGRKLIAEAEAVAREAFGARVMEMTVIDVRRELIAWYLRCGYRNTGETRPFPAPGNHPFAMVVLERALV